MSSFDRSLAAEEIFQNSHQFASTANSQCW